MVSSVRVTNVTSFFILDENENRGRARSEAIGYMGGEMATNNRRGTKSFSPYHPCVSHSQNGRQNDFLSIVVSEREREKIVTSRKQPKMYITFYYSFNYEFHS